MFYSASPDYTAFGGVDYSMTATMPYVAAAGKKKKWAPSPDTDPQCNLGVCTSDDQCAEGQHCGFTDRSQAPPDADCGDGPCPSYKCCRTKWKPKPRNDPECGLGVCTTDSDCGSDPEIQCGYTRSSRPPSSADCGDKPCESYKCCQREFTDYEGWDVPEENKEARDLCPFDTSLSCLVGCQVCDSADGGYEARCCTQDDTCPYTSQCEIPCTASSQFQGEGVGCMFCPEEGGLKACTVDTKPCTYNNWCTPYTRKKYVDPDAKNAMAPQQFLQLAARNYGLAHTRMSWQQRKENFW